MSTRTQTTRLPTGFKDDDKDEDMRRQLWFNKSVELTSAPVSMSKRQGDGTWLKLGVNADVSVKWLLGAPESSRPVLYRYRQLALIYARLLQGDKNDEFVVEMWKPYVSDDVKRLIVRGYQTDKDVLHRVSILEKFLFANFPIGVVFTSGPIIFCASKTASSTPKARVTCFSPFCTTEPGSMQSTSPSESRNFPKARLRRVSKASPTKLPLNSVSALPLFIVPSLAKTSSKLSDYRRQSCRPAPAIRRLTREGELLVYREIPVPFQQRARLALGTMAAVFFFCTKLTYRWRKQSERLLCSSNGASGCRSRLPRSPCRTPHC